MQDYLYTYAAFTGLVAPYTKPDSDRLSDEIRKSAIVTALDHIDMDDGAQDCNIWFKAALSSGDETLLAGIVAAHSGEPLVPKADPTPVKIVTSNLLDPDSSLSATDGHDVEIQAGQLITEHDISYPFEIDALAARYFVPADESRVSNADRFDVIGIPGGDPFVGYVTANVAQGETVIPVSETVFAYLRHGLSLKFASHDKVYKIKFDDPVAGTLTLFEGLEQAITLGDLIHIRRVMMENLQVAKGVERSLGDLSAGSSGLCANAKLKIRYRCAVAPTESFVLNFELIYSY